MRRCRRILSVGIVVFIYVSIVAACVSEGGRVRPAVPVQYTFQDVSVHDPSAVAGEDGSWYIFGSHLSAARSDDLMNWSYINRGVSNHNPIIPNVYQTMKDVFEWSHSNTFWAPDVVRLGDGKYHLYYCSCRGDAPVSCMGMAVSDTVAGPYKDEGIILRSGMEPPATDENGEPYRASSAPNVVDPCVFTDAKGRAWLVYGSYSGGIFIKEVSPQDGHPLTGGYGKRLLGGEHLRIEAPYVIYNPDTKYYYLFLSFGGLDSDGGYNIRVCRSLNPDGPYEDSMGQDMSECKGEKGSFFSDATAQLYGTKLMGGYKFQCHEGELGQERRGYVSPGHNCCFYDADKEQYFIVYHTRFEGRGEEHQIRVHLMFFNEDGWPVIAPYRYTGEREEPYAKEMVEGQYKLIFHGRDISDKMALSEEVRLQPDGAVSGVLEGSWELDGNRITLELDGKTYNGIYLRQWDEDGQKYVIAVTVLNRETGQCVWGSKVTAVE